MVVTVSNLWPVDLDYSSSRFDQASSQQAALTECVVAVLFSHFFRFSTQVKGFACLTRQDERKCLAVVFVQSVLADGLIEIIQASIDGFAEIRPSSQTILRHFGSQLQIVNLDPIHLGHIHVVADGIQGVRIKGPAHEPGGSPFADHTTLLQRAWHHDVRKHGDFRRLGLDDVATPVREVLGTRWFQLTRRADLVGCVTGHHLIDGGGVVEQTVGCIADGSQERRLVDHLSQLGEQFAELNTGQLGIDRLEHTADIVRYICLRIPQIQMTGATLQIDKDHMLGLAKPCPAVAFIFSSMQLFVAKQIGKRQTSEGRATHLQQCSTTEPIARVFTILARDHQHRSVSQGWTTEFQTETESLFQSHK